MNTQLIKTIKKIINEEQQPSENQIRTDYSKTVKVFFDYAKSLDTIAQYNSEVKTLKDELWKLKFKIDNTFNAYNFN
jgi:hypothetical protein